MASFLSNGHSSVVTIPTVEQNDNFTVYQIMMKVGSFFWKVDHRYSDFVELHDKLVSDHGVSKDLLPPKKVIGNKEPAFIERRRAGLEAYLSSIITLLRKTMPRDLALFLDFHMYDIIFLLQNLALYLFKEGDTLLQQSRHYYFTPLQIINNLSEHYCCAHDDHANPELLISLFLKHLWIERTELYDLHNVDRLADANKLHAISERLKQPCPSLEILDKRLDFSHVLDFCCQLKSITIKGSNTPVGTSNIVPNNLSFELSAFKGVEKLTLAGVQVSNIYNTGSLRDSVTTLEVHYSNLKIIKHVLLCDDLHKEVNSSGECYMWKKITEANFSYNEIEEIDESVKLMPNLEQLNLSNNKISALNNLTTLPHLSHLYLSVNLFTEVHDLHTKMGNVVYIDLSQNNISSLVGFSKLYSLEGLDMSGNQISDLVEIKHLSGLPCLENLVLTGNPVAIIVDYRVKVLEQFGNRVAELCLDNEKPTQKELDTVAVLQALRIVKEGKTPTFETKLPTFPQAT